MRSTTVPASDREPRSADPGPPLAPTTRGRPGTGPIAVVVGAVAALSVAAWSWVPSLWYDEAATVTSALRTWPQLWAELHTVDAVHGAYYALMHLWFDVVGYTPFSLRLPSAIAVGVAAALLVVLGQRLGSLRLGVLSAVVFTVLPRVQWAGSEGRPYAGVTALSVGLTLLVVAAWSRPAARARAWWVAYAALAVVAVTWNIYLSLVVVSHGVFLLWTRSADRRAARPGRPLAARPWVVAAAAAAALAAPSVLVVVSQARQVSWIAPVGERTVHQVFATAWFGWSSTYAAVAWTLMVLGVVVTAVVARRTGAVADAPLVRALRLALPVVVVPTAALVGATAAGVHLYSPKYASLSLPFVAMTIGLFLTWLLDRSRRLVGVVLALVVAISVPLAVEVRQPTAKQGTTWDVAAERIAEYRAAAPASREGVVFGSVARHPTATSDIVRLSYPEAFAGMTDIGVGRVGAEEGRLWNRNGVIAQVVPDRARDLDTVWFVGTPARTIEPEVDRVLRDVGFERQDRWTVGKVVVARYGRG